MFKLVLSGYIIKTLKCIIFGNESQLSVRKHLLLPRFSIKLD